MTQQPLDYARNETDYIDDYDEPYTPSTFTQAAIGGSIMLTIALALYGMAMIMQQAQASLAGLH